MAEWSIAAVLKTVELQGSGGSNPSLSAEIFGDVAQLEEHHNGIVGVVGSNPIISTESPLSWDDWAIQSF